MTRSNLGERYARPVSVVYLAHTIVDLQSRHHPSARLLRLLHSPAHGIQPPPLHQRARYLDRKQRNWAARLALGLSRALRFLCDHHGEHPESHPSSSSLMQPRFVPRTVWLRAWRDYAGVSPRPNGCSTPSTRSHSSSALPPTLCSGLEDICARAVSFLRSRRRCRWKGSSSTMGRKARGLPMCRLPQTP